MNMPGNNYPSQGPHMQRLMPVTKSLPIVTLQAARGKKLLDRGNPQQAACASEQHLVRHDADFLFSSRALSNPFLILQRGRRYLRPFSGFGVHHSYKLVACQNRNPLARDGAREDCALRLRARSSGHASDLLQTAQLPGGVKEWKRSYNGRPHGLALKS